MVDLFKKCYHDSPGQDNKFTSDSVRLSDMEYLHLWVVVTESNLIGLYRTDYLLFLQCNFVKTECLGFFLHILLYNNAILASMPVLCKFR